MNHLRRTCSGHKSPLFRPPRLHPPGGIENCATQFLPAPKTAPPASVFFSFYSSDADHIRSILRTDSLHSSMTRNVDKESTAVRLRLSAAQIKVLAPGIKLLVESYEIRQRSGTSPFSYPFRIFPPPRALGLTIQLRPTNAL